MHIQAFQKAEEAHTLAKKYRANSTEADQAIKNIELQTVAYSAKIKDREAKIEDQINRYMRSTLVLKGVPGYE